MSTLTSTSTLAEVKAAYDDNASYEEDSSVTKARSFITACRFLIRRLPQRAKHGGTSGGEEIEIDMTTLEKQLSEAQKWIQSNNTTGTGVGEVRFLSVQDNFR